MVGKKCTQLKGDEYNVMNAMGEEQQISDEMIAKLKEGEHGYVLDVKADGVVRLFVENANNLSLHNEQQH